MFRYVAFSWNVRQPNHPEKGERLERALCAHGWYPAFKMSGHRVFIHGHKPGINNAYALPGNQGVILGRLFRRGAVTDLGRDDIEFSEAEGRQIVQTDGRALAERFWGRYVAFLPSWTGLPRVLRDPTGTLPCYRVEVDGLTVILSRLDDLFQLLDLGSLPVDWSAVAAQLALGHISGRETLLSGVTQVLAGELTSVAPENHAHQRIWSAIDFARRALSDAPVEAAQSLRDAVTDCVQSWASCYESIVLRLSGGVDSSILLGTIATSKAPPNLICLNYFAPETDTDERSYARLAARQYDATLREELVDEAFRLEEVLKVARTPVPANYIGSMGTARMDTLVSASQGAGAVFNGAGGDQLFFERRCTWPAADYLKLRGFDRGVFNAVLQAAHLGNVSFWKALRQALTDRGFHGNPVDGAARFQTLMRPEATEAALKTAQRFIHPEWLAATDLPIGKFHQLSSVVSPLEYYNHYLRDAMPERVHPLMSQPLMELCLAIPTFVLTAGGRGRGLARAAFADRIPTEIATRRSKGGTERYLSTVLKRNLDFARQMLLDGLLAKQGLLDKESVEAALAGRPGARATPITEIHACIATEAWLQRATQPTDAHAA